jgi:acyl-CoA thioester hydrolase/bile acid acetyltransferase-like protein
VFTGNERRRLDVGVDSPLSGSYAGVNADGLLTSMHADGDSAQRAHFDSQWSDTVVTVFQLEVDGVVASVDTLWRTFGPPEIVARSVVDNGLVGTLFERADGSRRPGVIVLGGSEGGNGWHSGGQRGRGDRCLGAGRRVPLSDAHCETGAIAARGEVIS